MAGGFKIQSAGLLPFLLLLALIILGVLLHETSGAPSGLEAVVASRRVKRQSGGGGYDERRQDVGFGKGYGYGGYDEYCQDCAHCNGCGHQPNRRVLSEYDYVPK